ncbi:hypothetical protein [Streptomyces sp. NPDC055186]
MKRRRRWVLISLWAMWWAAVTAAFALLGAVTDQPMGLGECAAGAAFVIVVGELGDRLRRRFFPRRKVG